MLDETVASAVSAGIVAAKIANPVAYNAGKLFIKGVRVVSTKLDTILEDDNVSAQELTDALKECNSLGYGAQAAKLVFDLFRIIKK